MRQFLGLLAFFSAVLNLCAAVYVIYRDPRRRENLLFGLIAFMLAMTCIGEFLQIHGAGSGTVLVGSRLSVSMWILMSPLYVHFAMLVSGRPAGRRRWYLVGLYSFCAALAAVTAFTGLVVESIDFAPAAVNMNHEVGGPLWYPVTMLAGAVFFLGAAVLLAAALRAESRSERRRLELLIVATIAPVVGMGITYLLLPLFGVRVPLGYSAFTPFLAVFLAYAVTRYNLMTTVGSRIGSTLVSDINEAVLITGDTGAIQIANEAAARLTGYSPQELAGRRLEEFLPEPGEAPEGDEAAVMTVNAKGGRLVPVTVSVSPVRNRRGALLGSVVILHDMRDALHTMRVEREAREAEMAAEAERNRAELLEASRRELRERNAFLQRVLDNLAEPIFIKDNAFRYIYVNEAFLELTGLVRERIVGRTAPDIFDSHRSSLMIDSDREAFETGSVVEAGEPDWFEEIGHGRVLRVLKAPVMDDRGRPEYLIGIVHDLTEQKQLEKARLDFVRIAAHELRTPLTSLRLAAEMLEKSLSDRMDDQEERTLSVMMLSLQKLILLARNLLDLASMDAGMLTIEPVELEMERFISDVASTFLYDLAEKRLGLDIDCPGGLSPGLADPGRLWQVVANLLSNAIKYTDEGGIRIAAREDDGFIEVSVADTGSGIEPQCMGSIFSRFSRAQRAPDSRSGTGLGLSIAKGIVEAHGGRIWCESVPGEGSTFYFTIGRA